MNVCYEDIVAIFLEFHDFYNRIDLDEILLKKIVVTGGQEEVIGTLSVTEGDKEVFPLLSLVDELEGEGRADVLPHDQPLVENVVVDPSLSQLVSHGWRGEDNS